MNLIVCPTAVIENLLRERESIQGYKLPRAKATVMSSAFAKN